MFAPASELLAQTSTHSLRPEKAAPELRLSAFVGYNGENAHENLIWNVAAGWFAYSVNNKVVIETLGGKEQRVLQHGHDSEISTLALSPDGTFLASASGGPRPQGFANIVLWDVAKEFTLAHDLVFHDKGVQCLAFSPDINRPTSLRTAWCSAALL